MELDQQHNRSPRSRLSRLLRARGRSRPATPINRATTLVVVLLTALMATLGALNARGGDLRPGRHQDLADVVGSRAAENKRLQTRLAQLREDVDRLSKQDARDPKLAATLDEAAIRAGARAVRGPAVKVVLDDAPDEVNPKDVDPDLLIVHQQDIQMVVNIFWAAGAEAMTIQGQRVISTTGIKCVGNSVVLHDVPYAPPYEIVAIGDPAVLLAALDGSNQVTIYKQYAEVYQLGWKQERLGETTLPPYLSQGELKYAKPPR